MKNIKTKDTFYNILIFIILFLAYYNVNLFNYFPVSIIKILIVILTPIAIIQWHKKKNNYIFDYKEPIKIIILGLFIALYSFIITVITNNYDYEQTSKLLLVFIEGPIFVFLLSIILVCKLNYNLHKLLVLLYIIIFLQSIFVILSVYNSQVLLFFDKVAPFTTSTNIKYETSFRIVRGLSNASGASMSVLQSVGFVIGWYLIKLKKNTVINIIIFVSIFISCIFLGRTGIFVFIFVVIGDFLYSLKNIKGFLDVVKRSLFFILIFSIIYYYWNNNFLNTYNNSVDVEMFIEWSSSPFTQKDNTINSLMTNHFRLPQEWYSILFGAGYLPKEYENVLYGEYSDSGIIRNIFSIGLILTVFFYWNIYRCVKYAKKCGNILYFHFFILLFCITLMIEMKEPFLLKGFLPKLFLLFFFILCFKRKIIKQPPNEKIGYNI